MEARDLLQPAARELLLHRDLELTVVVGRDLNAREEVLHDRREERQVVGEELGHVRIAQRADEHEVLVEVGVGALEPARHHEHRLDRAQPVVVVRLLRELLRAEDVQLAHLARERLGVAEALGEEHDLSDERVVGHHHRDGSEAPAGCRQLVRPA